MSDRPSADIILITKTLRMEWSDALALDLALSPLDCRIGLIIGRHFSKSTGSTYLRNDTIARLAGVSPRSTWSSVKKLEDRGYLLVDRRELGFRVKDGRRVCGGRGVANTYRPAFERTQLVATSGGEKLAAKCDLLWKERSQKRARKDAAHCDPTLTEPTVQFPAVQKIVDQLRPLIGERASLRVTSGLEVVESPTPTIIFQYHHQRDHLASLLQGAVADLFPGYDIQVRDKAA